MKRLVRLLPLIVLVAGLLIVVIKLLELKEKKRGGNRAAVAQKARQLPIDPSPGDERRVAEQAFTAPESMDEERPGPVRKQAPLVTRSRIKPKVKTLGRPVPPARSERTGMESNLYYWADFAALREDDVLDPNSSRNQETIRQLMSMRQKRLGQVVK